MWGKIKQWLAAMKESARQQEYARGFNWAAGELLRGRETPESLEHYIQGPDKNRFDYGALDAIQRMAWLKGDALFYPPDAPYHIRNSASQHNTVHLVNLLESECCDLRCVDVPTGDGDATIQWIVVEHHMAVPHERVIGIGETARGALIAAFTQENKSVWDKDLIPLEG